MIAVISAKWKLNLMYELENCLSIPIIPFLNHTSNLHYLITHFCLFYSESILFWMKQTKIVLLVPVKKIEAETEVTVSFHTIEIVSF